MGEEIGERSSGMLPERFCCYFYGFGAILTVGAEESIQNHPEPTSQIPKSPKYSLKKDLPEDAPFFLLPTVSSFPISYSLESSSTINKIEK